jgi:1-acyl-sn-glycerol-3-phosphate acyltransferase
VLPYENFVPVLRSLERDAGLGTLVRKSALEVFDRTDAAIGDVAAQVFTNIARLPVEQRPAAMRGVEALREATEAARIAKQVTTDLPRAGLLTPFEVDGARLVGPLGDMREAIERGVRELSTVPGVAVPTFPAPIDDAARAAQVVQARRAAVAAELGERLSDPERAAIAKGQWHGPLRRVLGSAPVQHASGMDVLGLEHLRASPNAIVAPVHAGLWDLPRQMVGHGESFRTMAVDWLWNIPVAGPVLDHVGAFKVSYGSSAGAMRIATGALLDGQRLLMFPSGTIPMSREIMPARRGAALLAIRTGTPIVPVGEFGTAPARVYGKSPIARFLDGAHRSAIAYGEPIPTWHLDPNDRSHVIALTAEVERRQHDLSAAARAHVESLRS